MIPHGSSSRYINRVIPEMLSSQGPGAPQRQDMAHEGNGWLTTSAHMRRFVRLADVDRLVAICWGPRILSCIMTCACIHECKGGRASVPYSRRNQGKRVYLIVSLVNPDGGRGADVGMRCKAERRQPEFHVISDSHTMFTMHNIKLWPTRSNILFQPFKAKPNSTWKCKLKSSQRWVAGLMPSHFLPPSVLFRLLCLRLKSFSPSMLFFQDY